MSDYVKINKLIRAKNYLSALEFLLSLDKKKISFIDNKISIDSFLFNYFSKEKNFSDKLETQLAKKLPFRFVKAVRTSQVFIKKDRLIYLKDVPLKSELSVHKKVWTNLQQIEETIWSDIQNNLEKVLKIDIEEVLTETIFWLETERYHSDSKAKQYELATTYSFFINLYLHNTEQIVNANFSIDEVSNLDKTFLTKVTEKVKAKSEINPEISRLLKSINNWTSFNSNLLQAYCFDLNIKPKLENGIIYFNQKPINYYKWHLDGIRYEKNRIDYQEKATHLVSEEVGNRTLIIPGKSEEDLSNNMLGAIRERKMRLFLKDLNIYDTPYKKIENGLYKIFSTILAFSFNRFYRYEENLDYFKKTSNNWYEAYFKIFRLSIKKRTVITAFLLMDADEYVRRNENVFPCFDKQIFKEAFKILSYSINKKYKFNRFHSNYDVWHKPFIQIGKIYFSPMLFFANNDWFFSSSQVAIDITNKNLSIRKKTATEMENCLGDKFLEKGYKVKVIDDKQANKIEGDVDIIVEDEKTTLFIQLKRTYFRLNPKDAYYESMTSDKKASRQLNEAVKSLKKKNDFYNIYKEPVKWIVSTSFEFINTDIETCNKINYFDLLFALENKDLKSLNQIVKYLESNNNLFSFHNIKDDNLEKATQLLGIIGLPLELVEPRKYLSPVFTDNNYDKKYNELYSKAISLYQKKDKQAIKILNRCLLTNDNDIDVYGALGNCYANLKDLTNLQKAFEKALGIIPNEPYIKRNYALALIENKQYFKGIKMLQELHQDYNLIGDFTMIFIANYRIYKNKLSNKEDEIINSGWNNI